MLDALGHEQAKARGGSRESKQETIKEHEAKIIAGHHGNDKSDKKED